MVCKGTSASWELTRCRQVAHMKSHPLWKGFVYLRRNMFVFCTGSPYLEFLNFSEVSLSHENCRRHSHFTAVAWVISLAEQPSKYPFFSLPIICQVCCALLPQSWKVKKTSGFNSSPGFVKEPEVWPSNFWKVPFFVLTVDVLGFCSIPSRVCRYIFGRARCPMPTLNQTDVRRFQQP